MKALAGGIVAAVALSAVAVVGGLLLLPILLSGARTAAATPNAIALADIPAELLPVYRDAAASCGMQWSVLAAIGKIEGDHGRSSAAGVHAGTNAAGAAGPMQFLATTWQTYGVDADGDGVADVYDEVDAIWGAARYLCANGAADPTRLRDALWRYNHDDRYVDDVLATAARYAINTSGEPAGGHALPLPSSLLAVNTVRAPHHDYPAIDLPAPVGTPAFAVAGGTVIAADFGPGACGGTVIVDGNDGARYTYCHASALLVEPGQTVQPGAPLLLTGGQPGAFGAGDATGPHLHLAITVDGTSRCPQPLLEAWLAGVDADPAAAPTTGCTS